MLQGVGARFDFHMCKTLCDLRFVREQCSFSSRCSSMLLLEGLGKSSIL